ncbi:Hypothetical protein R9X50_00376400 [Acrodontium crateriforme]|uniref:MICOS complex subunit MIC12 n=1 Tax=Acrodontium crateriforme TaxID=150365 RepID=A0AAQ3RA52_9PEZI|nr:Hypothetical protein R9X50_00376400 [Acrodontium crateriforme]
MGFTMGLLGGFTLTTSLLYLSVQLHTRNRLYQSALLTQQSLVLENVVDPLPTPHAPVNRQIRLGAWETAKDRWNQELESNVKKLQNTDWSAVGERVEESISSVWRRAFQGTRDVIPDAPKK